MTIKTYLAHLEQVKQDLLALDLPENTRLINPPDMGFMSDFGDCSMEFIPKEVFVSNERCYAYEYLCDKQLTEKENVVVVRNVCFIR
jgi:hypothetical protein